MSSYYESRLNTQSVIIDGIIKDLDPSETERIKTIECNKLEQTEDWGDLSENFVKIKYPRKHTFCIIV